MADFLAYIFFVAAVIGFLRFAMRDLPMEEIPRTAPPTDPVDDDR